MVRSDFTAFEFETVVPWPLAPVVQPDAIRSAGPMVGARDSDLAAAVVAALAAQRLRDRARIARRDLARGGIVVRIRFGFFIRPSVQTRMAVEQLAIFRSVRERLRDGCRTINLSRCHGPLDGWTD